MGESKINFIGVHQLHPTKWFDSEWYDTIEYKKKRGAKHEFGTEIEPIIPAEGEIRLLGNRNR